MFWLKDFQNWWRLCFHRAEIEAQIAAVRAQFREDKQKRAIPEDLAGLRFKFARNLVGNWASPFEFGPFPTSHWQFLADGTAICRETSGMTGTSKRHFLWREVALQTIEMSELHELFERGEWEEPFEDDGDEETLEEGEHWARVAYDFKQLNGQIVLFSTPENEDENFKFWDGGFLVFEGDLK